MEEVHNADGINDDFITIDDKERKFIYLKDQNLSDFLNKTDVYVSLEGSEFSVNFKKGNEFMEYNCDESDLENIRDRISKLESICKNNENRKFIVDLVEVTNKEISYRNEAEFDSQFSSYEECGEGDLSELPNEDEILSGEIEQSDYLKSIGLEIEKNKGDHGKLSGNLIDFCLYSRGTEVVLHAMKEIKKLGINITDLLIKSTIDKVSKNNELNKKDKKTILAHIYSCFEKYEEEKQKKSPNLINKYNHSANISSVKKKLKESMIENGFEIKDINEVLCTNNNNKSIGI